MRTGRRTRRSSGDGTSRVRSFDKLTGRSTALCVHSIAFDGNNPTHVHAGVKAAVPPGMVGFVAREAVLPPELADAAPSAAANRCGMMVLGSWIRRCTV